MPAIVGTISGSRPYTSTTARRTTSTSGSLTGVRAGRSPLSSRSVMSLKPRESRCRRSFVKMSSGSWSGTRRKSIFAIARAGSTVFAPSPS